MGSLLVLLLLFQEASLSPFEQAVLDKREGRFLAAEGALLALETSEANHMAVALELAEIALYADPAIKRGYYTSELSRDRWSRARSLVVLCALTAAQRDFEAFKTYALLYFREFPSQDPLRYRLLYYMARYTDIALDDVPLSEGEQRWFQTAVDLDPTLRFPAADGDVPYEYRVLHRLHDQEPFTVPSPPLDASGSDKLSADLLRIHVAMLNNDLNQAAVLINRTKPTLDDLNRLDQRVLFTDQMIAFFEARAQENFATISRRNRERLAARAVLPLLLLPGHLVERSEEAPVAEPEPQPEAEEEPEDVVEDTPEPVAPQPEPKEEEAESDNPFLRLERRLKQGARGLEFRIRARNTNTPYRRIYRNYLLGLHYLNGNQMRDAKEYLDTALRQIKDLPFPVLEAKILTALADYYQQQDEPDKAGWYRLDAMQIWNAPQHLPVLIENDDQSLVSPHKLLIDQTLQQAVREDVAGRLFYYSALDHFVQLRTLAYRRAVLHRNPVINNQMRQVGTRLAGLVRRLADEGDAGVPPERYNEALDLWDRSWSQADLFWRNTSIPDLKQVQSSLNRRDRLVIFVEGYLRLGVLLISREQTFALDLGPKNALLALKTDERINFINARIGDIWNPGGVLYLHPSQSIKEAGLLDELRALVENAAQFQILLSLKAVFGQRQIAGTCDRGVTITRFSRPALGNDQTVARWQPLSSQGLNEETAASALQDMGHIVFVGSVRRTDDGVLLGQGNQSFPLHKLVHYNAGLCSVTLVSADVAWGLLLDELAVIHPSAQFAFTLMDDVNKLEDFSFTSRKQGLSLP